MEHQHHNTNKWYIKERHNAKTKKEEFSMMFDAPIPEVASVNILMMMRKAMFVFKYPQAEVL